MSDGRDGSSRNGTTANGTVKLRDVIATARGEFEMLTGRRVESVSSVRRSDAGWALSLEVVELERVPSSTSILGSYDATVDRDGSVIEYERTRRYYRNQASEVDA